MKSIHFQQVYKEIIQLQIQIKRTEATQLTKYNKKKLNHIMQKNIKKNIFKQNLIVKGLALLFRFGLGSLVLVIFQIEIEVKLLLNWM